MAKTLLLLGGTRYAIPVIDAAHRLGARVITCDYLPDNYAHRFSDGYINVSIVDAEAVLAAARQVRADGVMSFAADPGVLSAAYVAEKLGLPFQGSYKTVMTLQDKSQFRAFLRDNGFNCPESFSYSSTEQAMRDASVFPYPVIVKPVDSAGSKGVSRVDEADELRAALGKASAASPSGRVIVERFLEKWGCTASADCFFTGEKLICILNSQLFDDQSPNPYAPCAYLMPSTLPKWAQVELTGELGKLCKALGLRRGLYNVELRIAGKKPYVMELSPRGGGNRLCEMLKCATGIDLIRASVQAALGMPVDPLPEARFDAIWYQQILHSNHAGVFRGMSYNDSFRSRHVVDEQIWVNSGDPVEAFTAANKAFGSVMMRFSDYKELSDFLIDQGAYFHAEVDRGA